ncbi:MAG: SDR family oxidoreductase [Verrucomicrobia bacterium]|nr:SDR family oxidoreductase [Verrucomicrobiota bacterium]MCH8514040.1 SDR family oxidoreductase [Kiritimatiellia bacterium]
MKQHAIIFGATGGIGRALTDLLLEKGWAVTAVGRDAEKLDGLPNEVTKIVADATLVDGAAKAFEATKSSGIPVTACVNCIGNLFLKPLHRTTAKEFTDVMRIHVFSSFSILQAAVKRMEAGGSVALMSSAAARTGMVNHESIAAAKGAVEGLTRAAAATYAPKGIRINAVAPGLTETPMTRHLTSGPARAVSEKMHVLGRLGKPEDIASALAWLIDPAQSWVTGEIIHVDGGLAHLRGMGK